MNTIRTGWKFQNSENALPIGSFLTLNYPCARFFTKAFFNDLTLHIHMPLSFFLLPYWVKTYFLTYHQEKHTAFHKWKFSCSLVFDSLWPNGLHFRRGTINPFPWKWYWWAHFKISPFLKVFVFHHVAEAQQRVESPSVIFWTFHVECF